MLHAWPHTVAHALPATPMPSTATNSRLNTMHITVPSIMVMSARPGLPAVRRKLFMPMPSDWKAKNTQMICTNVFVGS